MAPRHLLAAALLALLPLLALAQMGGGTGRGPSGSGGMGGGMGQGMGKAPGPRPEEPRAVQRDIGDLVPLRLSQLEEDLQPTPAQMPQWKAYRAAVERMLDDVKRGPRVMASETTAPKKLDGIADVVRNRAAASEEIADAGKALYAVLSPLQREIADRRLALPLATLLGSDPGSEVAGARGPGGGGAPGSGPGAGAPPR